MTSIENLLGCTFNDTLACSSLANRLFGNLGKDTITGGAGAGADHFRYQHALDGVTNIDRLTDFSSGVDLIELSASIFTAFAGQIGQTIGLNANLNYSNVTGVLAYDADGAGGAAPLTFAILGGASALATLGNDFIVVN